jgi:Bacterial Ig domain
VDGNTITDNSDADGLEQEISYGKSTFRNNIVLRNGAQVNSSNSTAQISVRASAGVTAYCNVIEIPRGRGINGWTVGASDRGYSKYPPYQYLATTGNSFHHNTVIWDPGATGAVGFLQNDAGNQPSFFASNATPDFNSYHVSSPFAAYFVYDNNNSQSNTSKTFTIYQAAHTDVRATADTNYNSGFPTVAITYPTDQSSFTNSLTITAAASDTTGISKVEFYVDWGLQATVTSPPYNLDLLLGVTGPHTVTAMAYSNAGVHACYAVTLNKQ